MRGAPAGLNIPARRTARTAYVGQQPRLVAGTVRGNLLLGNEDTAEPRLWDALRLAAVDDVVRALPDRLDTAVGEGGSLLSAGQRQRIALARAFLRDAPLLLLDEPTSALDADTERRVLAGVAQHARSGRPSGRTVVVAAHRTAVLDIADVVVDLLAPADVPEPTGTLVAAR